MESDSIYQNFECRNIKNTSGPQTLNHRQDEGKDEKGRGSRCLVLMTVCLGLICVLLLVIIIFITAERESLFKSYKNTVEEFNQTINRLQDNYTDLTQKKLELETRVTSLRFFFISSELNWSESRKYCRDRGADLVIINTEEKQKFISSIVKESVWIGLSDIETEGRMMWVDNSPLNQEFWFKDQPDDYNGNEDCVELIPTQDAGNNWNDLPCSHKRKGICEKN
ncbi:CD209 antigen-like protein E [Chanodichthys erythropterus]|uniref:CD209 antigen-like protein E n=1 Tax=Chanodichthys erythropterus TaxID=933992 RepID=UPI00351EB3A4